MLSMNVFNNLNVLDERVGPGHVRSPVILPNAFVHVPRTSQLCPPNEAYNLSNISVLLYC